MRVILLGTAGYHPTSTRQTACVLLPELGILLDGGTGMFRVGPLLKTQTLDIFLSHAHLDHIVGLTYFFTLLDQRPLARIRLHGEPEKLAAVREHLFHPAIFPGKPPFDWTPLADETRFENGAVVRSFPLQHPGGSRGFRIEHGGKSLAYVTDTSAKTSGDYLDAIRGVDLLLHECNFPAGHDELAQRTGHSALPDVVAVAREAGVKRLVLMHFDPALEVTPEQLAEVRPIFPATELGSDGLELDV